MAWNVFLFSPAEGAINNERLNEFEKSLANENFKNAQRTESVLPQRTEKAELFQLVFTEAQLSSQLGSLSKSSLICNERQ